MTLMANSPFMNVMGISWWLHIPEVLEGHIFHGIAMFSFAARLYKDHNWSLNRWPAPLHLISELFSSGRSDIPYLVSNTGEDFDEPTVYRGSWPGGLLPGVNIDVVAGPVLYPKEASIKLWLQKPLRPRTQSIWIYHNMTWRELKMRMRMTMMSYWNMFIS